MEVRCDLHTHSSVSDGTLTPRELVDEAARVCVNVLALTDHDTVAGIAEARAQAEVRDIELVPGIELSVNEEDGRRQMHILGLGIDPEFPELLEHVARFESERQARGERIVQRLNELGVPLRFESVTQIAGRGALGRPHVARALVEMGACRNEDEAFARFLRRGRPAYVPREAQSAATAIDLVHAAGGIASLAHPPLSIGIDAPGGLPRFVGRLVAVGLDGLEVHHPNHKPAQRRRLKRLVRQHELIETGGSDFHGARRPDVALGRGRGDLSLGAEILEGLRQRLERRRRAPVADQPAVG